MSIATPQHEAVAAHGIMDDAELARRASERDVAAFEALVIRFRSKMYGLALRMMRDPVEAEEVLQESFLSAWRSLPTFRGESAVGSWLHRICANFCLMRLRRKKVETSDALLEEAMPEPLFDAEGSLLSTSSYDWTRGTEEKALDNELGLAIERATAALPDDYRAVFLLKDIEGLSYEEIAQSLGTTVPAVKSRLHRARLALRETIDAFYEAGEQPRAVARGLGSVVLSPRGQTRSSGPQRAAGGTSRMNIAL